MTVFSLLAAASLTLAPPPKPVREMTPAELDAFVTELHAIPDEGERMARASERFLGTP